VSGVDLFFSGAKSKGKKNEVETVLELIEMLEVKDSVITLDAMSTQRAVAENIKQKQGDYISALKGNQGKLHKEVKAYFHKCHRDNELVKAHLSRGRRKRTWSHPEAQLYSIACDCLQRTIATLVRASKRRRSHSGSSHRRQEIE
jgi:predicted transposase YbfD/YdcC